jgi:hypothetical protein
MAAIADIDRNVGVKAACRRKVGASTGIAERLLLTERESP